MTNFGFNWMYLVTVNCKNRFEYESLLYNHEIPFESNEKGNKCEIKVPEKYFKISREIIDDYQSGRLVDPVNDFNPRYSNFIRGKKVRRNVDYSRVRKANYLILLVMMMLMLGFQMLIYIRK